MPASETYEAFMLDYAAGNLSRSMQVAASIHRLMSSRGEEAATLWECVSTALMDAQPATRTSGPEQGADRALSLALDLIHLDYSEIEWKRGLSGVKFAKSPNSAGQLMRLEPGQGVLSHGHSALEATVVLEGVLDDGNGIYGQGDILLAERGLKHRPSAYGARACTCYVARSPKPFWRLT